MIHPAVVSTITKRGAMENAQKKASDAPVVEALSEIQLRAAQAVSATVFFIIPFTST
jgi:hypothetical protein